MLVLQMHSSGQLPAHHPAIVAVVIVVVLVLPLLLNLMRSSFVDASPHGGHWVAPIAEILLRDLVWQDADADGVLPGQAVVALDREAVVRRDGADADDERRGIDQRRDLLLLRIHH